jgi:hypothetical protein
MYRTRSALVLLAIVLVVTNAQCVAACATAQCGDLSPVSHSDTKLPPCHRHHGPHAPDAQKACAESAVLAGGSTQSVEMMRQAAVHFLAISMEPRWKGLFSSLYTNPAEAASPPLDTGGLSLTILRI